MSVLETKDAFVVPGVTSISLSQMFAGTASSTNPAYLVLTRLDRDEYTAGATGATGSLSGDGQTASFGDDGGDGRSVGIVFTYNAATGQYSNAEYGFLNQMTYTASGSLNDVTSLSLFGTNNPYLADTDASDPYSLMQADASGYLGSVTIATQPGFASPAPVQATPDSIASVAESFVGRAWNMDGCWVLASTIAAEAGAALPVQSTEVGLPGVGNGEWIVAFNGPTAKTGNWQSMVRAGDIIVIGNSSGLAHITTCVSGSSATAMLVDNITYVGTRGQVTNLANDGSREDVTIAAPHQASLEWQGVQTSDVVIYRLDTPVIAETEASARLTTGATLAVGTIFSAADPANRAITEYQIYDTGSTDSLKVNGGTVSAHSAAAADTVASLGSVCLAAGGSACTDSVEVRAFNGTYWGDWQSVSVSVIALAPPTLAQQTANQTWNQGSRISFTLNPSTFADPQGEALTYAAVQANGQALPTWLTFNAASRTFSGTVPSGVQTLSVKVTATDTGGLSAAETFQVSVPASAPRLVAQTAQQLWTAGQKVAFTLPANTFADPQGETLSYAATQANGQALPSWLTFNAATRVFSGTAPQLSETLSLKVTATDTSALSASELVPVTVIAPPAKVAGANPSERMSFILPQGSSGDIMTYAASEISGAGQLPSMQVAGDFSCPASNGSGVRGLATDLAGKTGLMTFAPTTGHSSSLSTMLPSHS